MLKLVINDLNILSRISRSLANDEIYHKNTQRLIIKMFNIMHYNHGAGLSAIQVNRSVRLFITDILIKSLSISSTNKGFDVFINPIITSVSSETNICNEGCLSLPNRSIPISRPNEITFTAKNQFGESNSFCVKGNFARLILHEIDHLNGILITDSIHLLQEKVQLSKKDYLSKLGSFMLFVQKTYKRFTAFYFVVLLFF